MHKFNLLFLGVLLALGINTAQARVCFLPIPDLCDLDLPDYGEGGGNVVDPQPQQPVEKCTQAGEYKTLEDCQKVLTDNGWDQSHKCHQKGECYIIGSLCLKGTYPSLDECNRIASSLSLPPYNDKECKKVEGEECWEVIDLCSEENKRTARSMGYTVSGEEAIRKTGKEPDESSYSLSGNGTFCVPFINKSCNLWNCSTAEIGFHWVKEEAQKRDMYLDCRKPANAKYCPNNLDSKSCNAGAEKHCESLGSRMASRQDIWNHMDYINQKWKQWFPHHRDPSYHGWAMIFCGFANGDHNEIGTFQVSDGAEGGNFRDMTGSNSTGCSIEYSESHNDDVGYYICIKEIEE